ncbi:MAG: hypothetical protein KIS91_16275 [Anaerolineae bacterium]|nr:hypothetical protein [Anaerolineae bacterium]
MLADLDNDMALHTALAQGWVVEPPVYAMTDALRRDRRVLQFILWRDGRPRVVTVDDTPEVRGWIDAQGWTVAVLR